MTARLILVVDDDDAIREITQMALEMVGGWRVVSASGGAEGIAMAQEHHPDAVLLDVMMPVMDGLTTFSKMQADPSIKDIPVILLTAKVQVGDRQMWDEHAVYGVISKPFDPMTLTAKVTQLLGWGE